MDVLSPNVWILSLMCLLGMVTSAYCVMLGNRIYQKRQPDVNEASSSLDEGGSDDVSSGDQLDTPQSSADTSERLNELHDAEDAVQRLQEMLQERASQEKKRRQQFALRIARVVIEEFQDVNAPLTHDPSSGSATKERRAEKRATAEHDTKSTPVGQAEAESQSPAA